MESTEMSDIHIYEDVDECPHEPGNEELWSESLAVMVWDPTRDVYVYLHLTQEPNRDGKGYTTVWLNAWTPKYTYHHSDDSIPLERGDITRSTITSANGLCKYEFNGKHLWTVHDREVEISLVMEDYHKGFGYYPRKSGSFVDSTQKEHIEGTGWIKGTITIKGEKHEIEGQAWRDHSWGARDYQGILSLRVNYAIFEREFNFFGVTFIGRDGRLVRRALVIQNDRFQVTDNFTVVAHMAEDGVSYWGSTVTCELAGKTCKIDFAPVGKALISVHQGCALCDSMCTATMDGKVGAGFMQTTFRAQGGTDRPHVFPDSPAILENGVYTR